MKPTLHVIAILLLASVSSSAFAQTQTTIPSEVSEFWSALVGDWRIEGTVGSRSVTGSATFEGAEGTFCIIGKQDWEIEGNGRTIHLAQIIGWDPANKEIIEQGFSSVNGAATVRYPVPSKKPQVMNGTIEGVSGPDNEWSGKVTIELKGADEFQLTSTIDGDVVHWLKYVRKK